MSEATRLIDELTRVMEGDAWFGSPVREILQDVRAAEAAARPGPKAHSIWELVRHMTSWTDEVAHRIAGRPAGEPELGDWPAPSGSGEQAWKADVAALFDAHRRLVEQLASCSDATLGEPTNDPRNRPAGTGVRKDVMLQGLAHHHAYHGGQIALVKKLLR